MMESLPAPHGKSPGVACIIGVLFGGLGLAIYLRNVVDFVLPLGIGIAAVATLGDVGVIGGAIIAGLYGYYRVHLANTAPARA